MEGHVTEVRRTGERSFEGGELGAGVCVIRVDMAPRDGPRLHRHPYEEVFVVLEGDAEFTAGDAKVRATAGESIVVPPNTPHLFVNTGEDRLRLVAIHVSPAFDTEWLEE
jgi:quercetin dioxygenase-like cupin family protein